MITVKYKNSARVDSLKKMAPMCASEQCFSKPASGSRYCRQCRHKVREKLQSNHAKKTQAAAGYDFSLCDTNLYAVFSGRSMVKFGISHNVLSRVADLQVSNPVKLTLAAFLPCNRKLEFLVHKYLQADWLTGEWHRLSLNGRLTINFMTNGNIKGLVKFVTQEND